MNQAIEYTKVEQSLLAVGARRKNVTAYLITVNTGAALLRLGKHEFVLTAGSGFWVPFECLHALTVLPGCCYNMINFSARLQQPLCQQAGFVTVTPLLNALLQELNQTQEQSQTNHSPAGRILAVIVDQTAKFSPVTQQICPALPGKLQSVLKKLLERQSPASDDGFSSIEAILGMSVRELEACLIVREAIRLSRSGRNAEQVASELEYQLDHLQALGQTLADYQF
ncbi:AraC family ligand binding domain-containing protein [Photobacterium halotolerans]|uniref:AraC-type arabinose-binding/dimerisation domain-containing protein n=1 Tax=Photobacterium halotolerans TaxID=265726 RepID=A0A7X4WER4_9GAMM|nr:AraC family ligand binding domain-containing protein [Photobacterium halotolerans]NAW67401.1 hypothetical protein [Photobacterium halotolerans]NAW87445.1 hypothetical protein [Photobacterium halotolerans]NAX46670.1 hypothetical protein [Photobacterium halotolerans]